MTEDVHDGDTAPLRSWVGWTYDGLADLLVTGSAGTWDAPSLCVGWQVQHVVAHVTMPARLSAEQFGAELVAAGGDFTRLSDTVATRDASLPGAELVAALRSPVLHGWRPPGGGAAGALSHAVIHSLDVTVALGRPPVAPAEGVVAVLDQLTAADGAYFGIDLTGVRLAAADTAWRWGDGEVVRAGSGPLLALLSGRTLPDGRALSRR
ncbi:maleylpyruvate isomerase family mycothiol-dependent enzyme [Modestobacter sp. VKM Ac-2984]|uniref:maleylpyruvate isomerase family mycothiol-dependent enzyme n=1 Tax=Modestobacter sp. VKM Ac-2984 TaxID=3004138 RepID=UPI0022AA916B|nr:maleylpyruvate isomerase family mycothiol-dependent enzyme [Modestobacter sp. VKM Ac-2984]MCZ2815254.1 maleylpyruvate isomerase family mycothiol-dependent enzyme [Modestobacter sp. VKM Ac-2984]